MTPDQSATWSLAGQCVICGDCVDECLCDEDTMIDLGGGMIVRLSELLESDLD